MLRVLLVVVVFAVATYCLIRVIERRGVARPVIRGRSERRPTQRPTPRPTQRPAQRPIAPDDDEEFLRDLDRRRRHPEDPDAG